jgi:cob(I)alamin adenosyltransferase
MKIYTGYGDKGYTSLSGGKKVKKSDKRIEVYGTLDELNSCLGIIHAKSNITEIKKIIMHIQNELFVISAEISSPAGKMPSSIKAIDKQNIQQLESWIDLLDNPLPTLKNFILPSGTETSATIHLARTITRRAERLLVKLMENISFREELLVYLNRLSDLLFIMARFENYKNDAKEHFWKQK